MTNHRLHRAITDAGTVTAFGYEVLRVVADLHQATHGVPGRMRIVDEILPTLRGPGETIARERRVADISLAIAALGNHGYLQEVGGDRWTLTAKAGEVLHLEQGTDT